ncbi:MAG: Xaa-Pro peptidase family protein [Clostridium sp.]|nr:Xaa-Pro peptidase family protein [Clostridium sp.]MCM1398293.1 Xaa-Pro peptidase family protein [Clostridium sp.]MCM1459043.1 Xaa-Pro peptidase family protein [Bacteroides sp.]
MTDKKDLLIKLVSDKKLDGMLLTDGYNIHYLSGYSGHEGCMLVTDEDAYIFTDSRYTEQLKKQAPNFKCIDIKGKSYSYRVNEVLEKRAKDLGRPCNIGFENMHISYDWYDKFSQTLNNTVNFVRLDNEINALRAVKAPWEIERLAKAETVGDEAFRHILSFIRVGMTEKEIAAELEYTMKRLSADGTSFDTIVASGENSSMPHAAVSDRKIGRGDFITMDFGCIYEGYCSDMTRTVIVGDEVSDKQLAVYNTVLKAQTEALKLVKPGVKCSDVDACARQIIADAGYGDYFGHGLGHGVGLFIHEEPRFSPKCDELLRPGVCITVEPGIYLPGLFGVRIEDMIVVTEDGYRNLASSPKELIKLKV